MEKLKDWKGGKVERWKSGKVLCAAALFAVACGIPCEVNAVEVDGIAAKVGSETILKSDVAMEMMRRGLRDASRYGDVLEDMIERKLIVKAAKDAKMVVPEWIVENRVREIIQKSFDGDRNKLIEMLGQQRTSYPEWYARLKEDVIVGAMRWNSVNKNITASPAEMKKMFDAHPENYASNSFVSVSAIVLKPEDRVRRDEISSALKEKKKTFEELGATKYANVKPEDAFQPAVCAALAQLKKGETSDWIDMDGWSFLLRKDDEQVGRKLTFAEAFDMIEADVKEAKAKKLFTDWIARLKEETFIKIYE